MKKTLFGLLILLMTVVSSLSIFAAPTPVPSSQSSVTSVKQEGDTKDVFDRIGEVMDSEEAEKIAIDVLSPALKITAIFFIILGIVSVVGAVSYLGVAIVKSLCGKGKVSKSHLGLAGAALFVGICLTGGAWFAILKFGRDVAVDPVNDKIIAPEVISSPASN